MRRRGLVGLRGGFLASWTLAALLGAAGAQDTRIPIHDLVQPDRIQTASPRDGFVELRPVRGVTRNVMGEVSLRSPRSGGLLGSAELAALIGNLTGAEMRPQIEDGWLLVSRPEAARAAAAVNLVRRHLQSQDVEIDLKLEYVQAADSEVVLQGTRRSRSGETVVLGDVVTHRALIDFDVEIAQSATIANPVVGEASGGASIAVRTRPVPRSDLAAVEAIVRIGDVDVSEQIDLGHSVMKRIQRYSNAGAECGISFLIRREAPAVHEWTSFDGRTLRLTSTARWADPPANPETRAIVTSPLLTAPLLSFAWRWFDPADRFSGPEEPLGPDELRAAIEHWMASRQDVLLQSRDEDSRTGVILFGGEAAQDHVAGLANLIRVSLIGSDLSVAVLDCPAGQPVTASGPLPEGTRVLARASGPVLAGQSVCFAGRLERSFVQDWNAEVAQSSRIADPRVALSEDGYWITALVTSSPADQRFTVALECEVIDCDLSASAETLMGGQLISPDKVNAYTYGSGNTSTTRTPAILLPEENVRMELPVIRTGRMAASVQLLRGGGTVLRQAAPNLLGQGRELVVVMSLR